MCGLKAGTNMGSRLRFGGVGIVIAVLVGACVADEPDVPGGTSDSNDGGGAGNEGGTGEGGKIVSGPPTHAAAAVAFVDVDLATGTVGGAVRFTKAADETDVTSYAIYAADAAGAKVGTALGKLSATGKNLAFQIKEGT